ncbi:MAG: hypothetical protein K8R02_08190 [Anaerohalosphaeraceae bacterium]|nr:hypothetical protein [Anaerohalosphaeraceae bacterium]
MGNEKQEQKNRKKTSVFRVLISLVIFVAVLGAIILFSIDGIIKVGIEKAVTKQLGVEATVGSVRLNIFSGNIQIYDLKIKNPDGYEYDNILELHSASASAKLSSLFSDTIEISQVLLDGMTIAIEQKGLGSNLNDVLKSMPKSDSPSDSEPTDSNAPAKKAKNVHIALLNIKKVKVNAKLLSIPGKDDAVSLTLPKINLVDIGSNKKATLEQVIGKVFAAIAEAIAKEGTSVLPKMLTSSVNEILKTNLKTITETGENLLKDAGVSEKVEDITEGIKDIFKKK